MLDPEQLFTIEECTKLFKLSKPMIYRLIHTGVLETITIGRSRRVPASAITEAIARLVERGEA